MKSNLTLEAIAALVDWQATGIHETRQGKKKPVMTGIPTRKFWDAWKTDKLLIRDAGLSLSFEKVHKTRETATGQQAKSNGAYKQARPVKAWQVTAWLGHRNARLVDLAGLPWPEETECEPVPHVIYLPCSDESLIDCPF